MQYKEPALTVEEKELYEYAKKRLMDYFSARGRVSRRCAYAVLVDTFSREKLFVPHWAFFMVLDELEEEGLFRLDPVTKVVDYDVVWKQ